MTTRDGSDTPETDTAPAHRAGAPVSGSDADIFSAILSSTQTVRRDRLRASLDTFLAERDLSRGLATWFAMTDVRPKNYGALRALIVRDVAAVDEILGRQVDLVLHHPRFQRLEASWRGLSHLVSETDVPEGTDGPTVFIRVLDLSWKDLAKDIERAADFDQSQLFKKVYDAEFGIAGGEPFGLLLGDYEVRHRPGPGAPVNDVGVLDGIAQVAAAAFAPFIVGGHPALLGLDEFRDLDLPVDLARTFQGIEYTRWNSFRRSEDARFVGITMPRVLMRTPYFADGSRREGFPYREDVSGNLGHSYLWGTAVYAFGIVVARSFRRFGWPAAIRGIPRDRGAGGGIVPRLPVPEFGTDRPGLVPRCPADVAITDRREQELSELGFIALCRGRDSSDLVFFSNPSVQAPQKYDTDAATANARLSAMVQCMLSVSRFAHYVKILGRDKVGSFSTPKGCESELKSWLAQYCTRSEDASAELRAQRPLADANVEVREHPSRPGAYTCVLHLRPHFQVEHLASAVRLVTEFAPISAG